MTRKTRKPKWAIDQEFHQKRYRDAAQKLLDEYASFPPGVNAADITADQLKLIVDRLGLIGSR